MTGFTLPTSRPITQAWGAEFDDWDGDGTVDYPGGFYHSIGWDGHNGIDYGCFVGDPVEAVTDGVVAFAGDAGNWHAILSGGGNAVLIEHPAYSVQTEYLHLSRWLVQAGQTVKKGQVIGRSGKTGAATAPHLHLGMLKLSGYNLNDRMRGRIDPTPYLYGNLNPDYAGGAAIAPQGTTTTPKELFTMGQYEDLVDRLDEVKNIAANTHAGIWKGGTAPNGKSFNYGILPIVAESQRRDNIAQAQISNLVAAIAALSKGEAFDEAKLLAGVQAAAEAGVKAGIADGTVTVDVNVNGAV